MIRLVIGIGNEYRNDDAAGLEVARRVRSAPTLESSLGGYELLDMWDGADDVTLVDAMASGEEPGTIWTFDPLAEPLPAAGFASTHAVGIAEAVEMARRLGRLPDRLTVFGIEAASVAMGTTVSPPVQLAIEKVVRTIDGRADGA